VQLVLVKEAFRPAELVERIRLLVHKKRDQYRDQGGPRGRTLRR
jgi:hypothetical protein